MGKKISGKAAMPIVKKAARDVSASRRCWEACLSIGGFFTASIKYHADVASEQKTTDAPDGASRLKPGQITIIEKGKE